MSASYIIQNNQNMISQGQAHNPLVPLYLFPPGDDIEKYKTYEHYNAERNFNTQFWPYGNKNLAMQNPWWIVNREFFNNNKQRYMFTGSLNWKITSWMRATGRLRLIIVKIPIPERSVHLPTNYLLRIMVTTRRCVLNIRTFMRMLF